MPVGRAYILRQNLAQALKNANYVQSPNLGSRKDDREMAIKLNEITTAQYV